MFPKAMLLQSKGVSPYKEEPCVHNVTRCRSGKALPSPLLPTLELNPPQIMKRFRFIDFLCPNSPFVWDGSGLSSCFDNLVLGFVVNAATIFLVSFIGFTARDTRRDRKMGFLEKTLLHYLPVLGACLSCVNVVLLLKKRLDGEFIMYFMWLSTCTQCLVWVMITFFWGCARADTIFSNTIVGILWMVRPIVGLLHLQGTFSSAEVFELVKESCIVFLDVMFGISVNFFRLKHASPKSSSMDDPLLPAEMDIEEGYLKELALQLPLRKSLIVDIVILAAFVPLCFIWFAVSSLFSLLER